MSKCPKCGTTIEPQQKRAGLALWAGMTSLERKIEMARRRQVGRERKLKEKEQL